MQIFGPCSRESDAVGLVKPCKSNFKPPLKEAGHSPQGPLKCPRNHWDSVCPILFSYSSYDLYGTALVFLGRKNSSAIFLRAPLL